MKHPLLALILVAIIHVVAFGQARPTAGRLMGGSAVPTGSCNSSSTRTDIYVRTGSPKTVYFCDGGSWVLFSAGGTPGGSATQIQFNDSAVFGGDAGLTYDKTTDTLTISGPVTALSGSFGDGTLAGQAKFHELTANGSNYWSWLAPDTITNTLALKFPNADPTAGQVLSFGAPVANVSTGAWVLPATADSTTIFTNKTFSAEGTGNVLTTVAPIYLTAAGCSNVTPGTMWDLPVTTPAVAVCVTGTNVQKGALEFADSGPFIAQNSFALPADWTSTGGIDVSIYWTTTATSGDIKWNISTACAAVGGTAADDPAFNAAQVITTTTAGTTNFVNTSTQTALTLTGCTTTTPMMFHVKVMRDGTTAGDTIAATARLIGVEIRYRRAQ